MDAEEEKALKEIELSGTRFEIFILVTPRNLPEVLP